MTSTRLQRRKFKIMRMRAIKKITLKKNTLKFNAKRLDVEEIKRNFLK